MVSYCKHRFSSLSVLFSAVCLIVFALVVFCSNVQAQDNNGDSDKDREEIYPLRIVEPEAPSDLPPASVGVEYRASMRAEGGKPPYRWIPDHNMPPGLDIDWFSGVIYGKPEKGGDFTFAVVVQDSLGLEASRIYNLRVAHLKISTVGLPAAVKDDFYVTHLLVDGGTEPFNWSLVSGTLPEGLTLSSRGTIAGTPAESGEFTFTVRVTDHMGHTDTKLFNMAVSEYATLKIITESMPTMIQNSPFPVTLQASGGTPSYVWTLISGSLPEGLVLNTSGMISGTPKVPGLFHFTARVTDNTGHAVHKEYFLRVLDESGQAVFILTGDLPQAERYGHYQTVLHAGGGTRPYRWSLGPGSVLPEGLNLSTVGVLSGYPTVSGHFNFTIMVRDAAGNTAQKQFKLVTTGVAQLRITTTTLPQAEENVDYAVILRHSGGTFPYNFTLVSGMLPPGIALESGGMLAGIPREMGLFTFTVRLTDGRGSVAEKIFSITVTPPSLGAMQVVTSELELAYTDVYYYMELEAAGGLEPYRWSLAAGKLPSGLVLYEEGKIYGTPRESGDFSFVVRVGDDKFGSAQASASKRLILHVEESDINPIITTSAFPGVEQGVPFRFDLSVSGGRAPYAWSIHSGSLPPGLVLGPDGAITGQPNAGGYYSFTVRVRDALGLSATRTFSMRVGTLFITTKELPEGTLLGLYREPLHVTGGDGNYGWTLLAGNLPSGLSLQRDGLITGVPTSTGLYSFTVRVGDGSGNSETAAFSLRILEKSMIMQTEDFPPLLTGIPWVYSLEATGGEPPYNWSLVSGSLPSGIELHGNGTLAGRPFKTGEYIFRIKVADQDGLFRERQFVQQVFATAEELAATQQSAARPDDVTGFTDMQGHWAAADVAELVKKRVVAGRTANTFDPEAAVTRAEFTVFLSRLLGLYRGAGELLFVDVQPDTWFYSNLAAVYEAGLVSGRDSQKFEPAGMITRQEMAVMVARVLRRHDFVPVGTDRVKHFIDAERIATWAVSDLSLTVEHGLMGGFPGGYFLPAGTATRAETAAVLKRLLGALQ